MINSSLSSLASGLVLALALGCRSQSSGPRLVSSRSAATESTVRVLENAQHEVQIDTLAYADDFLVSQIALACMEAMAKEAFHRPPEPGAVPREILATAHGGKPLRFPVAEIHRDDLPAIRATIQAWLERLPSPAGPALIAP